MQALCADNSSRGSSRSTLHPHIGGVVSGSPAEQVIGTHARRIVAMVADEEAVFYRADEGQISEAMCAHPHPVRYDAAVTPMV